MDILSILYLWKLCVKWNENEMGIYLFFCFVLFCFAWKLLEMIPTPLNPVDWGLFSTFCCAPGWIADNFSIMGVKGRWMALLNWFCSLCWCVFPQGMRSSTLLYKNRARVILKGNTIHLCQSHSLPGSIP